MIPSPKRLVNVANVLSSVCPRFCLLILCILCQDFDHVVYNSVMEIANPVHEASTLTRFATSEDAGEITYLLKTAVFHHLHVDWRTPVDWLTEGAFVVQEKHPPKNRLNGIARQLFGPATRLQGCLAIAADPLPAAWVRVAALANVPDPQTSLLGMIEMAKEYLRETAVQQIGWLIMDEWPQEWLPDLGFTCVNHIETYIKTDLTLPPLVPNPHLIIRPATLNDMKELESIETAAFEPLWRHSAHSLSLAHREAISFQVAIYHETIVGFQLSARSTSGAHLVRLTVAPHMQGQGVGSALLAHAIDEYRQQGLYWVSLNTQVDNINSQNLYRKFGFQANGQQFPVWAMHI